MAQMKTGCSWTRLTEESASEGGKRGGQGWESVWVVLARMRSAF